MTTLSIVIPAYNEEQGIASIIDRVYAVRQVLRESGVDGFELLVVNDGSRDRTLAIAMEKEKEMPELRVIDHPHNKGYGAALKTGFCHAKGDLVGFLDADGTYPPECFPELCAAAMHGSDLVIGSRMAGAASQMPATRRFGNWFFANLLSMVGCQRVTDSASGMRVFKKEILERLYPLPDGLNLTPVMSARALHENVCVTEVPIPYSERVGRSKLSVIRDGSVFLKSILWTAMSYNPVRILGMIGVSGVATAVLIGLGFVIARLSGSTEIGPWGVAALFIALFSGVGGVSMYALGATFNYLVSLFYHRPIRQGLLGRPMFKKPLDRHFGWLGLVALLVGLVISISSLALGISGWEISRLWLYLLGGALFMLVGMQFMIYWILIQVLDQLSQRELHTQQDMQLS
jgi:glycosyltransferase involved in cell wall biosynthesis